MDSVDTTIVLSKHVNKVVYKDLPNEVGDVTKKSIPDALRGSLITKEIPQAEFYIKGGSYMLKFVSFWALNRGVDSNETWKYWRETHSLWAKEKVLPDAKKYTINKVVRAFGEGDLFAFSEVWFDDFDTALKAAGRIIKAQPDELLSERITVPRMTAPNRIFVDEHEVTL